MHGIILIAGVIIYYYINSTKEIYNYDGISSSVKESEDESLQDEEAIIVHVIGAVKNEGIVKVKENARINDVIEAAGGLTEDADLNNVNLAYVVEDGQKIYIPSISDNIDKENMENMVSQGAGVGITGEVSESESGLININTAGQEKLQELPGIGSSTALKIVTYRSENGKFKDIEDIKNVSGIGEAKYEQIKLHICV